MKRLQELTTPEEFNTILKENNKQVLVRIVESIAEAFEEGKEEAIVFEVSFTNGQGRHEVYYEKDYWEELLEKVIEGLSKEEKYSNQVIEAYELLQTIKQNK